MSFEYIVKSLSHLSKMPIEKTSWNKCFGMITNGIKRIGIRKMALEKMALEKMALGQMALEQMALEQNASKYIVLEMMAWN